MVNFEAITDFNFRQKLRKNLGECVEGNGWIGLSSYRIEFGCNIQCETRSLQDVKEYTRPSLYSFIISN